MTWQCETAIRLIDGGCMPTKADTGDWYDVYTNESVFLNAGESTVIRLGFACRLPDGYEGWLLPRSSTFRKYGILITNSMGIIDNAYQGDSDEWGLAVYATRAVAIPSGTRIAQMRIMHSQNVLRFMVTDHLSGTPRGGFGSTYN